MQSLSELHRRLQKLNQTAQLTLQQWQQAQVCALACAQCTHIAGLS